jgi:hypothetical protein
VAVGSLASQPLQSRYARCDIDIRREGVFRALVDLLVDVARVVNAIASVAMLQLNFVRVSAGERLESAVGVLKGGLHLGQLDVSIEAVTDVTASRMNLMTLMEMLMNSRIESSRRREVW